MKNTFMMKIDGEYKQIKSCQECGYIEEDLDDYLEYGHPMEYRCGIKSGNAPQIKNKSIIQDYCPCILKNKDIVVYEDIFKKKIAQYKYGVMDRDNIVALLKEEDIANDLCEVLSSKKHKFFTVVEAKYTDGEITY